MERIITVSNRLPITISKKADNIIYTPSPGGLATGLSSACKNDHNLWIGWPGFQPEKHNVDPDEIRKKLMEDNLIPVFLTQTDVELFYEGFSNATLWPLFHCFPQYTTFDEDQWENYKKVNQLFCDEVVKYANENDIIWIHDYHLLLLPSLIRKKLPGARIAFFQHIPFPSYDSFRILPWRYEILQGLAGADLIGFHTHDDVKRFLTSINRILGLDKKMGEVRNQERIFYVDAFPLGIDYKKFEKAAISESTEKQMAEFSKEFKNNKIILSIDRLDYSKGIPERLRAYKLFLERYPEYQEKVSLVMIVVPSREMVLMYKNLKTEIDELVGNINAKYRTLNWTPIIYFYRAFSFDSLSAFYRMADVALITPLRDGMNLVSKEYIASKPDQTGVLILSEMAGAAKELTEALIINPFNINETAEALNDALCLPLEEQKRRMEEMQSLLKVYDVEKWTNVFLKKLKDVTIKQKELSMKIATSSIQEKIVMDYMKAKKRILFLDYDGTLVPIKNKPELAQPDKELYDLLYNLSKQPNTELVLVTGRDKDTMQKWFYDLQIQIIAEHGAWSRINNEWKLLKKITGDWKSKIYPILEIFVDRTPGAFIEEKDYSLVWHYRRADAQLADARVRELMDYLQYLTTNMGLTVLEGKKVIEIKSSLVNKGVGIKKWLRKEYDFILSAGDDWTDEDMFHAMPDHAYTLKIGFSPSYAKYNIKPCNENSCIEMRSFLKLLFQNVTEEVL
jgi:trehalose 6-phosphate synthase/phosphatase